MPCRKTGCQQTPKQAAALMTKVAQYDCLHDEGAEYAKALEQGGVPVELHEIEGAMHGYDIAQDSGLINGIMEMRLRFLRDILA